MPSIGQTRFCSHYTLQLSHLIMKRLVQYLLKQIHKDPLLSIVL